MKRPLSTVVVFFLLLAKIVLTPIVFIWVFITHFYPQLLKFWNPTPLKILHVRFTEEEITREAHPRVIAYALIPPALDMGVFAPDYESYLIQTTKTYEITVNRPELLSRIKPEILKRIIIRDFEQFGLRAKELHVVISNSKNFRTIVHSLV
jgi:hypothetical protein